MDALPTYASNDLFATDFTPFVKLPGFFPGAGGLFHGHPNPKKRFLFYGTDFGPLAYQCGLPETGGEPESVVTLRQLRQIVVQAGLPLKHCFLTNAVLCMRRGRSAVGPFPIWRSHGAYVSACADWHRRQITKWKPEAVVLMGRPHLAHFGKLLFEELAAHWSGLKTMSSVYEAGKEVYRSPNGINVLLMLHPSFWHAHPPALKAKAIEHLSAWA